jgi:hypothetical protein
MPEELRCTLCGACDGEALLSSQRNFHICSLRAHGGLKLRRFYLRFVSGIGARKLSSTVSREQAVSRSD